MSLPDAIEASTAESVTSCLKQFKFCVDKLKGVQNTHINSRRADFKLWADSVGAVAQEQACLDWRFRDRQDDISFIKGLLAMLEWFLKECAASSGNEKAVEEALGKIDSMVHNLISIGIAIRRSGRKSRLQKADASFERNRERYLGLRAHLACVIGSKPSEGQRTPSDSDHLAKMELPTIQNRLVEANLRRRHRFMEAQRHSHLLKGPSPTVPDSLPIQQLNEILSTTGTKLPTEDPETPEISSKLERTPTDTVASINRITTPGTIASTPETGFKGLQHKDHANSIVTRITAITAAARYPRAKTSSIEQFSFKCPCCCQAIPAKEAEDSQFRKHLANDICPYTCFLDNCPTPYKLFVTEKEWNEHFMNTHQPKFQCPCCDSATLNSLAEIMSHFQLYHPEISDDELADALAKSAVHVMGITKCPLCDSEDSQDSPELIEHILEHIHDFSLRSLPWPKDPVSNLNKVAGTFNITVQDVNRIIQWVNKSSPKKECQLQASDFDRNSPMEEDTASKHSKADYFAQNDYFMDESSDGRFLSKSVQSYLSGSNSRQSATSKSDDPQDWEREAYDYPSHVPDVLDFSEDDGFDGLDTRLSVPEDSAEKTNLKAMTPVERWRKISAVIIKRNKMRKILEAARLYNHSEHTDEKPNVEAKGTRKAKELGQSDYFMDLTFSPDGKTLALASGNSTVKLWDAASGAVVQTLKSHSASVNAVAFSPDGKTLASVSGDMTVKLWGAPTGDLQKTLEGHSDWVMAIAFSPDSKQIASGSVDQTIKLWDAQTGDLQKTLKGYFDSINAVAFSPNGRMLVSASGNGTVILWNLATGAVVQTFKGHSDSINAISFSLDGRMLASASNDQTVILWNFATGAVVQTLKGHSDSINAISFSPDGRTLASASDDQTVKLWDTGSGAVLQTLSDTLTSMANLALTHREQGRWKEAEELQVQVMEMRKRMLGAEHPVTLNSITELASTYRDQGRCQEAEELLVQVLETHKRVLGAEHPDTLNSMVTLALIWKEQGRDAEAIGLKRECVQLQRRILGADHPHVFSSSNELARWEAESGQQRHTMDEVNVRDEGFTVLSGGVDPIAESVSPP
jgi:WD40 repeat protein